MDKSTTVRSSTLLVKSVFTLHLMLAVELILQDEYTLFPSKYANGVHGYLLVYSINSRQSFDMITTIYDKIVDFSGARQVPVVIVGQKVDLKPEDR